MKQFKRSVFLLMFFLTLSITLPAQIIKGAEEAVKKAENKAIEKGIEKTLNGLVNKLFGSDSTSTSTSGEKSDSLAEKKTFNSLFSSKVVDKKYDFNLTLVMETTTEDKKGRKDVINSLGHYYSEGEYIGAETEGVLNIMDFGEMKNYSIIGGKVTIINLQTMIDKANKIAKKQKNMEEEEDISPPTIKKTGKTEIIAGFKCEEFIMEDESILGSYWLTQEIGVPSDIFAKSFNMNPSVEIPDETKGIILKMIIEHKEEKTKTHMLVTEVRKDKLSYDLSKYKATDLSRLKF